MPRPPPSSSTPWPFDPQPVPGFARPASTIATEPFAVEVATLEQLLDAPQLAHRRPSVRPACQRSRSGWGICTRAHIGGSYVVSVNLPHGNGPFRLFRSCSEPSDGVPSERLKAIEYSSL